MKKAATRRTPVPAIVKGPQPDDMIPVRRDQLLAIQNDIIGKLPCGEVFNASLWIQVAINEHDKQFAEPELVNRITPEGVTTDIAENHKEPV